MGGSLQSNGKKDVIVYGSFSETYLAVWPLPSLRKAILVFLGR